MTDDARGAARRQRVGLIVLAVLAVLAGGLSFWGTRDSWQVVALPTAAGAAGGEVPIDEMALPSAPHRAEFQAACIICHSARLPLTQPQLSREKWIEIIHKMAAAYGAPVTPDEEPPIAEYLLAVQEPRG